MSCTHKTISDHSTLDRNVRIWACSACGKRAPWAEGWGYLGSIECRRCGTAEIEKVACSEACAKSLGIDTKPPKDGVRRPATPRAPKKPKWQRDAERHGWRPPT